jgi:putative membrane-bound dehydrogenase-like protein
MIPRVALILVVFGFSSARAAEAGYQIGVAEVDITPGYPIRLSGFGFRRSESEGVTHPIFAKALAIVDTDPSHGPAVLLTVDNLGIPDYITREVAARLEKKAKLSPARLAITSTHTHTAPMLKNVAPTLFGRPIAPDQQEKIDRYTTELTDNLEEVALAALKSLQPGKLEFGIGTVGFSINRRTPGGPVDHDLPILVARDVDGTIRAIYTSYACHCVTLSHNKISGDWAGYALDMIQKNHPGAIALASVGCGADSNPDSNPVGDRVDVAERQARQIADEVERLLKQVLTPITDPLDTALNRITLAFDKLPTREHFEQVAKTDDYAGYHARVQLARLDRGEKLQTELSYPVQTWTFGKQLAMVFLPGEVVVDYSIRLKREFDRSRLLINAYSNDVPCYIPSERILKEGGYEGGGAMIFYDRPTRLAPGLEQKIVDEVHRQLPNDFLAPQGTEGVAPLSPQRSAQSIRTQPDLEVELVAAEPLVTSPVAIDWRADGRLWVCEMFDYPTGADGNWSPGGRIKVLDDQNHDGRFDRATVFLENIPFPTGVTAWGKGVLVCAAPDILYAEDTNGDGTADHVEKLFSGFVNTNYQARVNSLSIGLDNWIYGANGLLGGTITGGGDPLDIRNHDFRFRTLKGPLETVTGLTQQGRVRDDWGRWFGCNNSQALLHYPHEERYLRRNPHAPAPAPTVIPTGTGDLGRVFPISRTLERFNDPGNINQFTSACGLGLYRDTLLGEGFGNNAFTAEPVHNLVHRMIVTGEGAKVARNRAAGEEKSEFLASTDNWFRPVQIRTGPDGALYVVDMYRFLIEHPRWIPPERLAKLDVRAGADKGRIYRIRAKDKPLREVRDLSKLTAADLAAAIDSPNGTERDRVHVELLTRQDRAAVPALEKLAKVAALPQVRVQALAAIDALGAVSPALLLAAMKDADAHVRQHGLRLCEPLLHAPVAAEVADSMLGLTSDPSPLVRRQLAYTLGEWDDARAGNALAQLATAPLDDAELRIAVLSSSAHHCGEVLAAIMATPANTPGRDAWVPPLVATAAASGDDKLVSQAVLAVLPPDAPANATSFTALASLMDALDNRLQKLADVQPRIEHATNEARRIAADEAAPAATREAALRVLGRGTVSSEELTLLCSLASGASEETIRTAAMSALRRQQDRQVAVSLLDRWTQTSPAARAPIVGLLLTRDEWAAELLAAIKAKRLQPTELSLADRTQLTDSINPAIRKLAAEVFPKSSATNRAEVLRRYTDVSALAGTAARGAESFTKNCATCHALNGIGHEIGPDLAALRNKDADYFVKNILDPSAVVEPRFVNYVIAMKDGRTLSGVIKSESTASLTLATGGAAVETLSRAAIKSIRATSISMMPEGFESAFTPQQMADLVAFLKSGASAKKFAGNSPKTIESGKDGSLMLRAASAEIFGEHAVFETEYGNVGFWTGNDDQAVWTIHLTKPMEYDVYLDYACAAESAGNSYAIEVAGRALTGTVAATGADWSRYKRLMIGKLKLEPGQHRLIVRADAPVRGALMDLRAVALAPAGTKAHWPATTPAGANELPRDPAALARVVLDKATSPAARDAAINANPQFAAELIQEMTKDLPDKAVEYERIPSIWRVAISCGKRNDAAQIKGILAASLPQLDQPLRDWQAVAIGGGLINGISQKNVWPRERIAEILADDHALLQRWQRSLDEASAMADDEKVPPGTRYDALRMLGVEPWAKRGDQLARYLPKGVNGELQMGAVSALADVRSPHATEALIASLANLTEANGKLALDALLRDAPRATALLDALDAKKIDRSVLGDARIEKLKNHPDETIRKRAAAMF